jgi:uncharacterized protein YjbI with pentapeptide repeats
MANKEHLNLIKQGVRAWNEWSSEHLGPTLDVREADPGWTNVTGADRPGADLAGADLRSVDLREVDLRECDLRGANLNGCDVSGAKLAGAFLWRADLGGAIFDRANLIGTNLVEAATVSASFLEANLSNASFGESDHRSALFLGANLSNANLSDANFSYARFDGADLSGALLMSSSFKGASFYEANLFEAHLNSSDLSSADLRGADLSLAEVGLTTFGNNDLSTVKGLETVRHSAPSTIGIDTLYRSDGQISDAFLREAGIPEDFITFVPSLVGRAIEFYSCFISHSHLDDEFSRRLHSRMRHENLRVWYAPEDMKAGRKLHEEIFRAIQVHDKLLLVLSEQSMKSEWVMTEIRRAKKVEREEDRRKLFPIRLVDIETILSWECFDADSGKDLAAEVREYYIPDFSHWKDHDSFESEFAKLLSALRATEQ